MQAFYWLIAMIIFVVIEFLTAALTTIWFAGGSLAAFITAMLGFSVKIQLVVFVIVSFVLLIFTRPLASKYINKNTTKTNAEGLIGKKARITAQVNNDLATGAAVINGQEWTARSADNTIIPEGTIVTIKEISGVKLIVKENTEEV